jgi:predicted MFS family arabinose efflux permease
VSGPADERWNERIHLAISLVDALIWIAIAVGAVILGSYLVEQEWGDAAQYLLGGVVIALFGWLIYRGWTKRWSPADESEPRTDAP